MRTDDDRPILHLVQCADRADALLFQAFHHLRIMDDRAECTGCPIGGSVLSGDLNGAFDAVTEAEMFR